MAKVNPYKLGDKVLASREQDGTGHEEAVVVDVYSLLIGDDERPMVVVEFGDEKRAWLNAEGDDVKPTPTDEEEGDGEDEEPEPDEEVDDENGEPGHEESDG